jgi:ABC-2 type transport system permease protein
MTATQTATVVPVRTPARGVSNHARAIAVVWQRELIRFSRDRARIFSSLAQPVLFLFVLGTGLSSLVRSSSGGGIDFRTFLFPGVLGISVLFTAVFSGVSMVWDREFGFLREMFVAPVSTWAIVLGKCLGGATVATAQSLLMLVLAGLVGVPYAPLMMLEIIGVLFLMAFMVTALGLALVARIRQVQAAMPLVQLTIAPMMFLSGALFPLSHLPTWLAVVTRLNPLTYAIEPLRVLIFQHVRLAPTARAAIDPGISWGHWVVPAGLDVVFVFAAGLVLLTVSVLRFTRTE